MDYGFLDEFRRLINIYKNNYSLSNSKLAFVLEVNTNLDPIPLNNIENAKEIEKIKELNSFFGNLDPYQRLKLKAIFKFNIQFIHINKEINPILSQLKGLEVIENKENNLNLKKEFEEIKKEINTINRKIKIFDRAKIFTDISQKDFLSKLMGEFEI